MQVTEIVGIFDTGCTNTSMGLYSLSKLMGMDASIIKRYIVSRVNNGCKVCYSSVASGNSVRCIRVCIHNCRINSLEFSKLNCFVNIDDKLTETGGIIKDANGNNMIVQPYALIGLDIIRNSNIEFNKDYISLSDFDKDSYTRYWGDSNNCIHLYQDTVFSKLKDVFNFGEYLTLDI